MNPRAAVLSALIIGSAVPAASAAISLTDSFSGPTLTAGLEASAADTYTFSNGAVSNTGTSGRQYIRTVASNLRSQDFSMSLTYDIVDGYGGYGIAFFGLGSGAPDGTFTASRCVRSISATYPSISAAGISTRASIPARARWMSSNPWALPPVEPTGSASPSSANS